jgi:protein TonB
MITKKNSKFDLEGKRTVFFQLGMLVTGSLTLAAFTWQDPVLSDKIKADYRVEKTQIAYEEIKPDEPIELPKQVLEQTQKTEPQVAAVDPAQEIIKVITGTTKIPDPAALTLLNGLKAGTTDVIQLKKVPISAEVIEIPDLDAQFVGGYIELQRFIGKEVRYPQECLDFNEEGKVYVSFVIERDGSVSNVKVEQGASKALNKEAIRVIESSPSWIPGEVNHEPVRTRVRMPIVFSIG